MGKVIRASVLVLLLACSASAGVMMGGVYEPPPPPPPQQQSTQETQGPATQETVENGQETNLLVQIALNLLTLF